MNTHIRVLTPHAFTLYSSKDVHEGAHPGSFEVNEGAQPILIIESEGCARAKATTIKETTYSVSGVEVPGFVTTYGEIQNLPEPEEGTIFIVSSLAHSAAVAAGRSDTRVPNQIVRNSDGAVVGCLSVSR